MYAVVATGGKQYRVEPEQVLRVEKLAGNKGDRISFDQVLLYHDGEQLRIGQPTLSDIRVSGKILEQGKYRKIIVFKSKRRKGYHKKFGHRQQYTAVQIDGIEAA
uniref:Large ribosomal subunit protein bL21 n=1 Tax=Desulfatirhabdium butyrativorans TaxID=340467 RepID=A0A7C4W0A5_9BACT